MQPFNHIILDDIARRSIAALGNNAPINLDAFNEESADQNDIPAEEESVSLAPPEESGNATSSNIGNEGSVKFRPDPSDSADPDRSSKYVTLRYVL